MGDIVNILLFFTTATFNMLSFITYLWINIMTHILNTVLFVLNTIHYLDIYSLMMSTVIFLTIWFVLEALNKKIYLQKNNTYKNQKRKDPTHILRDTLFGSLERYSMFMRRHVLNGRLFDLIKSYYPDGVIQRRRLLKLFSKYLFNLDISNVPEDAHTINETINRLSLRCEGMYISIPEVTPDSGSTVKPVKSNFKKYIQRIPNIIPNGPDITDSITDVLDLTDIMEYQPISVTLINHIRYLMFYQKMYRNSYRKRDIGRDIRVWSMKGDFSRINTLIILDDVLNIESNKLEISDRIMYMELRGFSVYSDFYDTFAFGQFGSNGILTLDTLAKSFGKILDLISSPISERRHKLNIVADRSITIIIPYILNMYHEMIGDVVITDPIFYPYSFYLFFKNLKSGAIKKHRTITDTYLKILNNVTLVDLYFDTDDTDKKTDRVFGKQLKIRFDKYHNFYVVRDDLIMLLDMYSKVIVSDTVSDDINKNNSTSFELSGIQ
jgi:hypothetical protein